MTRMTKNELQARIEELETALSDAVTNMDSALLDNKGTTGRALGRLRWRVVEHLELDDKSRTTIVAEIDSMINNL